MDIDDDKILSRIFKNLIELEGAGFSWSIGKTRLCNIGEYQCRIFDTPTKDEDKRVIVSGYSNSLTEAISLAINDLGLGLGVGDAEQSKSSKRKKS